MMKFFRKYTKHLLAVFMALLLVVWLLPAGQKGWSNMGGFGNEVRGTAFGRTIRQGDMVKAFQETETLEALGIRWKMPWLYALDDLGYMQNIRHESQLRNLVERIRGSELTRDEWYMLREWAAHRRVEVPDQAVEQFKEKRGITPRAIAAIKQHVGLSTAQINDAIRSFLEVHEAAMRSADAVKVTEADIRQFVDDTRRQVRVALVTFDPAKFIDESYQPTDAELQEQFEKYKDVTSQPGVTTGYQLPDRVQIEFIRIDSTELADAQKVSDEESHSYWEQHRTEFLKPAPQPATTAPATQPEPPRPYETWAEARPKVDERLRQNKAREAAVRLARNMIDQLNRAQATQPATATNPATATTLPSDADTPFTRLVRSMESKYGEALSHGLTGLVDQQELMVQHPQLATAQVGGNLQQGVAVRQVAFLVNPLTTAADVPPNQTRFVRNVGETVNEVFLDPQGNVYVIRTVAVQPRRAPESIDQVREQVVQDIRKQRAMVTARERAEELSARAWEVGLEQAFNSSDLKAKLGDDAFKKPEPFAEKMVFDMGFGPTFYPNFIPGVGMNQKLIDATFSLIARSTTQPTPIRTVSDDQSNRVYVVQLLEVLPPTEAEYAQQREQARRHYLSERQLEVLTGYFSADQIRERVQWQDAPGTVRDEQAQAG